MMTNLKKRNFNVTVGNLSNSEIGLCVQEYITKIRKRVQNYLQFNGQFYNNQEYFHEFTFLDNFG